MIDDVISSSIIYLASFWCIVGVDYTFFKKTILGSFIQVKFVLCG